MLKRLLIISRPLLWINTIGPALLGLWLTGLLWHPQAIFFFIWLTLPFNLLIYGLNDIADFAIDQRSLRKGGYEGARIQRNEFASIAIATIGLNVPFLIASAFYLPIEANALIAAYVLIFIGYSLPPARFKARPFLDSLSNSGYAFPIAIFPAALGYAINWSALGALMTWSVAKHAYDAIQDIDEDRLEGVRTTPVVIGVRGTLLWCLFFWLMATALMTTFSIWLAVVNLLAVLLLVAPVWLTPTPSKAHSMYRFSIAYPYIVGGVAGVSLALSVFQGLS